MKSKITLKHPRPTVAQMKALQEALKQTTEQRDYYKKKFEDWRALSLQMAEAMSGPVRKLEPEAQLMRKMLSFLLEELNPFRVGSWVGMKFINTNFEPKFTPQNFAGHWTDLAGAPPILKGNKK